MSKTKIKRVSGLKWIYSIGTGPEYFMMSANMLCTFLEIKEDKLKQFKKWIKTLKQEEATDLNKFELWLKEIK